MRNLRSRREFDFIFTRDTSSDYQFKVGAALPAGLQEAIVALQDYFTSLVDGIGFYSFRVGESWVTATSVKTDVKDAAGRSVYEIRGHILPVGSVEEAWFDFVVLPAKGRKTRRASRIYRQQVASWDLLPVFLNLCGRRYQPLTWAFGVCPEATDTTGIHFDVRFVPAERKERSRIWRAIRRLLRILWN